MSPTIYLLTILGFLAGLVYSRIKNNTWKFDVDDFLEIILATTVIGFFIGVFVWFIIGASMQPDEVNYKMLKRNLSALKDGHEMHGRFFLGSGSFNGDMHYYGYEDLGHSTYKMVRFPNYSLIVEDVKEGENSYFVEIRAKANSNDIAWEYKNWFMGPFESDGFVEWEIHIPEGSVLKNDYKLDLE